MANPLLRFKEPGYALSCARFAGRYLVRSLAGLAHDYWKDGRAYEPDDLADTLPAAPDAAVVAKGAPKVPGNPRKPIIGPDGTWHAMPGEISEHMWGTDNVTPGDGDFTERLLRPLGLNKEMSVLDLSAGLGGRLRRATEEFGVYMSGLEPDPAIAVRGMEMSVASGVGKHAIIVSYDPMKLKVDRHYDCVIARETIYRVADKEKFIKSIIACCKPKAQASFTDYIVNPEVHDAPAMVAWREMEPGANPVGLVEMAELWAKAGLSLRVHDDQTDLYRKEVMMGLARFAKFMSSGVKPDAETKKAIDKRITTWAHRMAALNAGMKFYRFYGAR
jgi:cyclopropane fatty-acyl-phospholipid synthase-like methyltransferase